jgi:hypothetical protein
MTPFACKGKRPPPLMGTGSTKSIATLPVNAVSTLVGQKPAVRRTAMRKRKPSSPASKRNPTCRHADARQAESSRPHAHHRGRARRWWPFCSLSIFCWAFVPVVPGVRSPQQVMYRDSPRPETSVTAVEVGMINTARRLWRCGVRAQRRTGGIPPDKWFP